MARFTPVQMIPCRFYMDYRISYQESGFTSTTSSVFSTENTKGYRFAFNGMERDDEWNGVGNSYDFGARIYDARLGRWLAIDPLAGKYPSKSPFNFGANSPIAVVDIDGRDIIYVGTWSKKDKKHTKVMLKMRYGKAVYREYKKSTTDDIYIGKGEAEKDVYGRAVGAQTLYRADYYFQDESYDVYNFFGITPTFKSKNSPYGTFYRRWQMFEGVEINNQDAHAHFIKIDKNLLSDDSELNEYDIAEILIHEILAHAYIPTLLGQEAYSVEGDIHHDIYGQVILDENVEGSIAEDVHNDATSAEANKDDDDYEPSSDGSAELEKVKQKVDEYEEG